MLYKIIHQLVEVPHQYILTKAPASTRSGHGTSKFIHFLVYNIIQPFCVILVMLLSSLSHDLVTDTYLDSFSYINSILWFDVHTLCVHTYPHVLRLCLSSCIKAVHNLI